MVKSHNKRVKLKLQLQLQLQPLTVPGYSTDTANNSGNDGPLPGVGFKSKPRSLFHAICLSSLPFGVYSESDLFVMRLIAAVLVVCHQETLRLATITTISLTPVIAVSPDLMLVRVVPILLRSSPLPLV
ncbi:hypothetical protein V6N13_013065 [Hibiscus sabdariffa]